MASINKGTVEDRHERRRTPRFGVEFWVEENSGKAQYFHRVTNLSLGGFFIEKKLPFPVGEKVALRMDLPGAAQTMVVTGKIVDNYQDQNARLKGAGIQFLELDDRARGDIAAYLDRLREGHSVH
jgi:Tfp pilus assembly protein PilZ